MKKYKELKQKLMESEYVDGGALGQWPTPNSTRSAGNDFGVHRIDHSHQLQRIQTFLNAFTSREYIDPRAALSLMRVKLNLTGLDFDFTNRTNIDPSGRIVLKIKRFGGTFGTTPDHDLLKDGFKTTDGIEDSLDGAHLAIIVQVNEASSGLYKLDAKIIKYTGDGLPNPTEMPNDKVANHQEN